MKITISGDLGSGKSTVAKEIAKKLNYDYYSVGNFMREIAEEKSMNLLELSKIAEKGDEIDILLDKKLVEVGKKDNIVLDSRLAWHFIPDSIKVFMAVDVDEATKRIYSQKRENEKENISLEVTKENIIKRKQSELKRYKDYYNIDLDDLTVYDFIIDTTDTSIEEVIQNILKYLNQIENI